ncbi:hypothetical protein V1525DRAFT_428339 [Lipomyces kononenkoae]|uniref:Uncharacterized protein n=1 Tax=Lipomyces kononenkoae TaxID=34357 RepID=A0ACC3SV84_LIPKO
MHGLPLQLPIRIYLDTINDIVTGKNISEFNAVVLIHCHMANMVSGLEGSFDPVASSTLFTLFERELESVKTTFREIWTPELEISLQAAKLCLYDFSLCHTGRLASGARRLGHLEPAELLILTYGMTAASRMIDIFKSKLDNEYVVNNMVPSRLLICYSKRFVLLMIYASLFLFRILGMQSHLEKADIVLVRSKVQTAISVHRRLAREPGDQHDRVAGLIEVLARIEPSFYMEHFRSEYSQSLISECFQIARERRFGNLTRVESGDDASGVDADAVQVPPLLTDTQPTADPSVLLDADPVSQSDITISDFNSSELRWGVWDNVIFDSLMM